MRTYYRGRDALLTDEHFIWRTPAANRIFVLRDLRDVTLVHGMPVSSSLRVMFVTTAGLLALTVSSWALLGPATGYGAAAGAVLLGLAIVTIQSRRSARGWSLQGTYRGQPVMLYSSADIRVFNQVTRALRRAIEDTSPASRARGTVVA